MNRFILASHGDMAAGMKKTIMMLSGQNDNISAYGLHDGENIKDIGKKIKEEISDSENDSFVVITDLPGGSVNNEMLEILNEKKSFYLISGMNVALVLNLVLQEEISKEVILECMEEAKEGIQYMDLDEMKMSDDEEVDFFD